MLPLAPLLPWALGSRASGSSPAAGNEAPPMVTGSSIFCLISLIHVHFHPSFFHGGWCGVLVSFLVGAFARGASVLGYLCLSHGGFNSKNFACYLAAQYLNLRRKRVGIISFLRVIIVLGFSGLWGNCMSIMGI